MKRNKNGNYFFRNMRWGKCTTVVYKKPRSAGQWAVSVINTEQDVVPHFREYNAFFYVIARDEQEAAELGYEAFVRACDCKEWDLEENRHKIKRVRKCSL
jgi:hypothetical protein